MAAAPDAITVLRGHKADISSLSWLNAEDDKLQKGIFVGDISGVVSLWSLKTRRILNTGKAHESVLSINVLPSSHLLLTQGRERNIKMWDLNRSSSFDDGQEVNAYVAGCYTFCKLSLTASAALMAIPDEDPNIMQIWDSKTRTIVGVLDFEKQGQKFGACMCSKFVAPCHEKTGVIEDESNTMNNDDEAKKGKGHDEESTILIGYEDGSITLWCLRTFKLLSHLRVFDDPVLSLDVSQKQFGFCGSATKQFIKFSIDPKTQKLSISKELALKTPGVCDIHIRADEKFVAVGGVDGNIRLFGYKKCQPLCVLDRHSKSVSCLSTSYFNLSSTNNSQGRMIDKRKEGCQWLLAAGSRDSTVSIWSVYS